MRRHNSLHILRVDSSAQLEQSALDMMDHWLPVAAETATA